MSDRKCIFSADGIYRYTLWRDLDPLCLYNKGYVQFIGLNPSTATDEINDPTVRRCIGFAKKWGFSELCVTNLFAFRATDPSRMKLHFSPVGPDNDKWLQIISAKAGLIVAAWGVHGQYMDRATQVTEFLSGLYCLGFTKNGSPKHPLYVAKSATLEILETVMRVKG